MDCDRWDPCDFTDSSDGGYPGFTTSRKSVMYQPLNHKLRSISVAGGHQFSTERNLSVSSRNLSLCNARKMSELRGACGRRRSRSQSNRRVSSFCSNIDILKPTASLSLSNNYKHLDESSQEADGFSIPKSDEIIIEDRLEEQIVRLKEKVHEGRMNEKLKVEARFESQGSNCSTPKVKTKGEFPACSLLIR